MFVTEPEPFEDSPAQACRRPRNASVIGVLVVAAIFFSYLLAYCLVNALVAAEMMSRWQPGRDPRPKIFGAAFLTTLVVFSAAGVFFRSISRRQLNRIDEMEDDAASIDR